MVARNVRRFSMGGSGHVGGQNTWQMIGDKAPGLAGPPHPDTGFSNAPQATSLREIIGVDPQDHKKRARRIRSGPSTIDRSLSCQQHALRENGAIDIETVEIETARHRLPIDVAAIPARRMLAGRDLSVDKCRDTTAVEGEDRQRHMLCAGEAIADRRLAGERIRRVLQKLAPMSAPATGLSFPWLRGTVTVAVAVAGFPAASVTLYVAV